jgi:hypothetical protein
MTTDQIIENWKKALKIAQNNQEWHDVEDCEGIIRNLYRMYKPAEYRKIYGKK